MKISLIICSYNPREDYFKRTLHSLEDQTLKLIDWELLIIDNNSEYPISEKYNLHWHPYAQCLSEKEQGLTKARIRGIKESKGDLLLFLDDDNVLSPSYLENAWAIYNEYNFIGCWGGQCFPEFECKAPEWTKPYWCYLALRTFNEDNWTNEKNFRLVPFGAGMCIRRSVAEKYLKRTCENSLRQSLDRMGNNFNSGGDSDLAFTACDMGYGIGLFKILQLTHLIPDSRLQVEYLSALLEGISYSTELVKHLHNEPLDSVKKSFTQKIFQQYQRLRMKPGIRELNDAQERGKVKALNHIKSDFL